MSRERMVFGGVGLFLSGIVIFQPPVFWEDLFSFPRLLAQALDALLLCGVGVWIGMTFWTTPASALQADKVEDAVRQVLVLTNQLTAGLEVQKQLQVQLQQFGVGMGQFQAALQQQAALLGPLQQRVEGLHKLQDLVAGKG